LTKHGKNGYFSSVPAALQSEITVRVTCTRKKLFDALNEAGFSFKEKFQIEDYYYTHLDPMSQKIEFKILSKNSCLIRNVKLERKYFSADGVTSLLYKKKDIDDENRVKSEQKISATVDDMSSARRVLSSMGLKNWCIKKMTGHIFKKGTQELLVQEVENFGLFIEIEEFDGQKGTQAVKLGVLKKFVNNLGVSIGDDYHCNIAFMIYLQALNEKAKSKLKKPAPKIQSAKK
jgi:predicted adenylyl cyclase CyaB